MPGMHAAWSEPREGEGALREKSERNYTLTR
jgi:hypothetical protein